jgi:hypothetical protein
MKKTIVSLWLIAASSMLMLTTCDTRTPEYPARGQKKFTEVTISADGKLLAVLENTGTAQAKLLTRRIDQDTSSWQELPLPVFTSSVRFGLKGQALLLTHDLPENDDMGQLTRWDLADLQKNSEVIYQGPFLAFPIEARPGEYLVRSCQPRKYLNSDVNSCRERYADGTYWMLVRDQNTPPVRLTPDGVKLTFSQPSVTPQGFFWVTENIKERGDFSKGKFGSPGMLSSFPLPNGKAPTLSKEVVKTSTDVVCDRSMVRCIRQYNAGTDRKMNRPGF